MGLVNQCCKEQNKVINFDQNNKQQSISFNPHVSSIKNSYFVQSKFSGKILICSILQNKSQQQNKLYSALNIALNKINIKQKDLQMYEKPEKKIKKIKQQVIQNISNQKQNNSLKHVLNICDYKIKKHKTQNFILQNISQEYQPSLMKQDFQQNYKDIFLKPQSNILHDISIDPTLKNNSQYQPWNEQFQHKFEQVLQIKLDYQQVQWKKITQIQRKFIYDQIQPEFNPVCIALTSITNHCTMFNVKLLNQIIYPQIGQVPRQFETYNLKFLLNGFKRKVSIANGLPVILKKRIGLSGWAGIIQKGLMKICGNKKYKINKTYGDIIYHLIGWIPEIIYIKQITNKKTLWSKIYENFLQSNIMVIIVINYLQKNKNKEKSQKQIVLVILDMKQIKQQKLIKCRIFGNNKVIKTIKIQNLTPQFKYLLNITEQNKMEYFQNSCWINWKNILQNVNTLNLSWNPSIYSFLQTFHSKTIKKEKNLFFNIKYSIKTCPQYLIKIQPHDQDFEMRVFCELHNKNDIKNKVILKLFHYPGQRVVYPHQCLRHIEQQTQILGDVFIFQANIKTDIFILALISQNEEEIYYSMNIGSFLQLNIKQIGYRIIQSSIQVKDYFNQTDFGQNMFSPNFIKNKQYSITVNNDQTQLQFQLEGPQKCSIMLILIQDLNHNRDIRLINYQMIINQNISQGFYFQGISHLQTKLNKGYYILIISLINIEKGPYILTVSKLKNQITKFYGNNQKKNLNFSIEKITYQKYKIKQCRIGQWPKYVCIESFIFQEKMYLNMKTKFMECYYIPYMKIQNKMRICLKSIDYQKLYHQFYDEDISEKTIQLQPPKMQIIIYQLNRNNIKQKIQLTKLFYSQISSSSYGIYSSELTLTSQKKNVKGLVLLVLNLDHNINGQYKIEFMSSKCMIIKHYKSVEYFDKFIDKINKQCEKYEQTPTQSTKQINKHQKEIKIKAIKNNDKS